MTDNEKIHYKLVIFDWVQTKIRVSIGANVLKLHDLLELILKRWAGMIENYNEFLINFYEYTTNFSIRYKKLF